MRLARRSSILKAMEDSGATGTGAANLPATAKTTYGVTEVVSAIVLSAAALCTTFAGYQADLWDGEQAAHYSQANALRTESSRAALIANQIQGVDMMTFSNWLSARAAGEHTLEDFYRQRFRPPFAQAMDAWAALRPLENQNAPKTPFEMPQYRIPQRTQADTLERQAQDMFEAGQEANRKGDSFVLATVILANSLFFGGINQIPHDPRTRKVLLGVAIAFLGAGVAYLLTLPLAP